MLQLINDILVSCAGSIAAAGFIPAAGGCS